ncbi:MAG TPA: DUF6352 family protein [Casimicrobiaceae bacterium]|nr:DUF6352 family protein [Casimicrobiaceae bacterium]
MPDFWPSCGYRLLALGSDGRLTVTDEFLRGFLARPELAPVPESSAGELAIHDALSAHPRRVVTKPELAAVDDEDARDNLRIWLRFRDRLVASASIEAAYASLFRGDGVDVPPLFVHQLTQILLRHILGSDAEPLEARAAEMLFRTQKIAVTEDGSVMAADDEVIELHASTGGFGSLGELLRKQSVPTRSLDLDVLDSSNAAIYWERDERRDLSVSLNRGQPALDALCRVLEMWIAHFLAVEVRIVPERRIDDDRWVWHVGLDAEASGVLNDLYNRVDVDEDRMRRLLCLFRLEFADPADMRPAIAGRPVYLAMAMDANARLKLKPQNLILNLPLARQQ